jgi:dTDP-glucose 4,6-dehydratase
LHVLVTGGAGFIGSAVVEQLLAANDTEVVNVDRLTYPGSAATVARWGAQPRHHFRRTDVCDTPALLALLAEHRPVAVLHLAAESHVDHSIDSPVDFVQSNLVGTYSVLDAALAHWNGLRGEERERFRVLHVSTDEVFGALGPDDPPFTESSPYAPRSPYAASKAGADHLARAWHHTYGLPVVTSNCTNNYGPYQFPEKLIPLVIAKALRGEPIPVYGRGDNVRDWLHVDDHARALVALATHGTPGESYNVGAGCERTNIEVVHAICRVLDELRPGDAQVPYAQLVTHVTDRPGHDFRYAMDASKIEREIGWRAQVPFDAGLRDTVAWYLDNQDWCCAVTEGSDAGERLGLRRRADR